MTTTAEMNGATRDPRFVLLATSLGVLLAQIDTSVVNLGLKSIAGDLNAAALPLMLWPLWAVALGTATFAYYLRRRDGGPGRS